MSLIINYIIDTMRLLSTVILCLSLGAMGVSKLDAQKKFKFEREEFLNNDEEKILAPALLTPPAEGSTFKFINKNFFAIAGENYPAKLLNCTEVGKDEESDYSVEIYKLIPETSELLTAFRRPTFSGDGSAGYYIFGRYKVSLGARIRDKSGQILLNLELTNKDYEAKTFYQLSYDKSGKGSITNTYVEGEATTWASQESANKILASYYNDIERIHKINVSTMLNYQVRTAIENFYATAKYGKRQYLAVHPKLRELYPQEAAIDSEALPLYRDYFLNALTISEENKAKARELGDRLAALDLTGKTQDYLFFVGVHATMCYALAGDMEKAKHYHDMADKNDPNPYKPSVLKTMDYVYRRCNYVKLLVERPNPDVLIPRW